VTCVEHREVFRFGGALLEQIGMPSQIIDVVAEPCLPCPQKVEAELRMGAPPGRFASMQME
jgi:hypothetical protein